MSHLFPGQQPDEKILLVTRRHWFILLRDVVIVLALALLPMFLPDTPFMNLLQAVLFMFLLAALLTILVLYYLNMQVVTNVRIVDITQKNLLNHEVSELRLERVQDVTAEIKGIFGTLLNFGHVYVQTAGEMERFEFDNVPDPEAVAKLILGLTDHLPKSTTAKPI